MRNGEVLRWNTIRPPIGEELYRLKYWREQHRADIIARAAANFLEKLNQTWDIHVIIPMLPSDVEREFQPVQEMANAIGKKVSINVVHDYLIKIKQTSQLKDVDNPRERRKILKGAFAIKDSRYKDKNVLIFDDLYRSGTTMNAVASIFRKQGMVNNVYALTITKTRRKK